jgi:hypothetical protein
MLIILVSGCGKKNSTNNPVNAGGSGGQQIGFTLNGGSFGNQQFNISAAGSGVAYYTASENYTFGALSGSSNNHSVSVLLQFPGSGTGTFTWDTTTTGTAEIILTIDNVEYTGIPGNGNIKVTQYGSVGSNIGGTFSGELYAFNGTSIDTVAVSGGGFSMTRIGNQSPKISQIKRADKKIKNR